MPFPGNPPRALLQNPAPFARNLNMLDKRKARGKQEGRRALGRQGEESLFPAAPRFARETDQER
jgi:hypothetical protein